MADTVNLSTDKADGKMAFIDPEDGGSTSRRNACGLLPGCTAFTSQKVVLFTSKKMIPLKIDFASFLQGTPE
jgi:hypothetical protein